MEQWVAAHAWAAYLLIGVVVGFAAGLLGIGGGMVMVPLLVYVLGTQGFGDSGLHVALATAIATILFTSLSSVRAHNAFGSVDWPIVRAMAPGILAGAFVAALLAGLIPTRPLAILFTVLVFYAATQMLVDVRPGRPRALPSRPALFGVAALIGGVSSLLSAGGAFMSIPFLASCNVPLRRAIGTAAAIGFPIALAGTAGHVLQGLRDQSLPAGTLGYVYLPALGLIVVTSMATAPLGARLAHRVPVKRLRLVFALVLYAMAARMLVGLW
jgi:uncharacterized membrane protein YfcA